MPTSTRVLIADDEKNMRATLADILADEGYLVDAVESGEAAIRVCETGGYDILLMDVRMPGIDGIEAFRHIRQKHPGIRVILMSAYPVDTTKRQVLDEGATAFLPKPLDVESVVKLIEGVSDTAVLVVDNDSPTRQEMQQSLRHKGYRVSVAQSPQEALELFEQIRFEMVFINVALPVMNGLELYLAIRKLDPQAVAIMMVDQDRQMEEIAREAVRRTAYTLIRKPFDYSQVGNMLDRIARQRFSNSIDKPPMDG
jgi:DNA-binding NtrC family response regulator